MVKLSRRKLRYEQAVFRGSLQSPKLVSADYTHRRAPRPTSRLPENAPPIEQARKSVLPINGGLRKLRSFWATGYYGVANSVTKPASARTPVQLVFRVRHPAGVRMRLGAKSAARDGIAEHSCLEYSWHSFRRPIPRQGAKPWIVLLRPCKDRSCGSAQRDLDRCDEPHRGNPAGDEPAAPSDVVDRRYSRRVRRTLFRRAFQTRVQKRSRPLAFNVGRAFGPARKAISALASSAFFVVVLAAAAKRIS